MALQSGYSGHHFCLIKTTYAFNKTCPETMCFFERLLLHLETKILEVHVQNPDFPQNTVDPGRVEILDEGALSSLPYSPDSLAS